MTFSTTHGRGTKDTGDIGAQAWAWQDRQLQEALEPHMSSAGAPSRLR